MQNNISVKVIDLVKKSIKHYYETKDYFVPDLSNYYEDIFRQESGVFVTLHLEGQLRGCIGIIEGFDTVLNLIIQNSIAAAFDDPRFLPLTQAEFENVEIEVSILTKPENFNYRNSEELINKLSKDKPGVILEKGWQKATFLPSVWEEIASAEEFLDNLCIKAGMEVDEWRRGNVDVKLYRAEVYRELDNWITG